MAYKQIMVALSVALIATPGIARTSSPDAKDKVTADAKVDGKKYCIAYDKVVGSRISETECKTKADWARQGIDVDKMLRGE